MVSKSSTSVSPFYLPRKEALDTCKFEYDGSMNEMLYQSDPYFKSDLTTHTAFPVKPTWLELLVFQTEKKMNHAPLKL